MNADPGVLDPSPTGANSAVIEKAGIAAVVMEKTGTEHAASESVAQAPAPPELVIPMLLKHAAVQGSVMLRTRHSGNPFQELSKINLATLQRAAIGAVLAVVVVLLLA
jgi:hypothetical protein